ICKLDSDIYLITRIRKFVLLRLDYALSSGGATYDYPIITVEHVLPQNPAPESEWLELFPNEDIFYEYVHRLGNLVLLPRRKNSQAQNFEFEKKKEKYFTTAKGISPFVLTTQVLQEDEWSPEVIERRQAAALDVLKQEWDLNS
ncbi:MAG: HNH endonuclease, partial [bacterium]|nr:HNH endonuclease [bacterium]